MFENNRLFKLGVKLKLFSWNIDNIYKSNIPFKQENVHPCKNILNWK